MQLLFRQRFFSWLDSYDIYTENGDVAYTVEGKLSWGHCLHILDPRGAHVGTVKEEVFTLMPRFRAYAGELYIGEIRKEFTFFKPSFRLDFKDWHISGDFLEWNYSIENGAGAAVAYISKRLFKLTDTYVIDVADPGDALYALMVVLAIDAAKCSGGES